MTTYRINRSVIMTASRTGRLDLHGLSLDRVPVELFDNPLLVENVHSLDLSSNRLSSLPSDLVKMTKLKELLLDDNHFTALPIELCDLPSLRALSIEGNPLPPVLLKLSERARTVNTASGRGREATPVLQYLLQQEDAQIQQDSQRLADSSSAPGTPSVPSPVTSAPSSRSSTPTTSRPSSADSEAARTKLASLSSDIFSSGTAPPSGPSNSKRLIGAGRQTASNVFSCASQPYDGRTGKKVHTSAEGNALSAPFGTDYQPAEVVKARRLPAEESEKENSELSATTKNAPYAHLPEDTVKTGIRITRQQEQAQSPFATLPSATSYQSSSAHAQSAISNPSTPRTAAAGASAGAAKKAGDSEGMSAALSHMSLGSTSTSVTGQRRGIRIVDKGTSDIFGTEPVKESPRMEGKRHPSAESVSSEPQQVLGQPWVQKGGRARVNHGQKDSQLW